MGKTIDELAGKLDDREITAPDFRDTSWGRFLTEIDELLASDEYSWATDTLTGIYNWVEQKHWVTDPQRRVVANIRAGGERRQAQHSGGSRRYEGWRR